MRNFYLKLAFRSILRNRFFSVINLIGLSFGLAASLYIVSFLKQEYRFDSFHQKSDLIYRGIIEHRFNDQVKTAAFLPALAGPDIFGAVPEIKDYTRISEPSPLMVKFENTFYEIKNLSVADGRFFNFLDYHLLFGNPSEVLNSPGQIILSQTQATTIFGNNNPVGQSLIRGDGNLLTVSGIFEDVPVTSSIQFDALISYKTIESEKSAYLGWDGGKTFLTFFELTPGVPIETVANKVQRVLDDGINIRFSQSGYKLLMTLQNIRDIHLTTGLDWDLDSNRDKNFLLLIGFIGIIILAIAIVNYLNLASALAAERSKQIGVQKLSGAIRRKIIFQILIESIITTFFSSIIAIIIIWLAAPFFNNLLNTEVTFDILSTGLILIALILIAGILSGLYPALSLSGKSIINSFRQKELSSSKQPMRNALVVFQFGMAIIFIIALITVNRQLNFLLNKNTGFDKENILILHIPQKYENSKLNSLKQEINKLPEILNSSYSSEVVGGGITLNGFTIEGKDQVDIIYSLYVDEDFLDCYNIPLAGGRNFKRGGEFDQNSIIVNEEFLTKQNWNEWLGKGVSRDGKREIVGVVKDFNFAPLTRKIQPLIIGRNPGLDGWNFYVLNIRLKSGNMHSTISKIENIWNNFESNFPINYEFLEDRLNSAYKDIITYRKIVMMFSLLAVFIACIGLMGLTAFMNQLRTKEIGVRKVNGATTFGLLGMLVKDFAKWVIIALTLAVPISWYLLNNWLESFAYQANLSWWIFALAGLLALGIALLTVSWQSWKAATRNPVEALRYE